jgi:peroxiredoxin Q/BCP
VTYVIDTEGVARHFFSSQIEAARHLQEALEALKSIVSQNGS